MKNKKTSNDRNSITGKSAGAHNIIIPSLQIYLIS